MSIMMRRTIPVIIIIVVGFLTAVDYFVRGVPILTLSAAEVMQWGAIIFSFSLIAATLNTTIFHTNISLRRRHPPSGNEKDIVFSWLMLGTTILIAGLGWAFGTSNPIYTKVYEVISTPMGTWSALAGISIFLAVYRGFKIKNVASICFAISALAYLSNIAPIGQTFVPWYAAFGVWLLNVVNMASIRGILIGLGIIAVLWSIRVLLAKERGFFAREKEA